MKLKIVVLGTEDTLFVHNFSGYEKQDFNLFELENFDEDLGIEVDGGEIETMYSAIEYRLNNEDFDPEDSYYVEKFGMPILKKEDKENFYQIISHCQDSIEATKPFNEHVKKYLVSKGLIFENTEVIASEEPEDETLFNKYLWLNFAIEGVDTFY